MKGCELCPATARMYCESDQASLCFDCDARVHGANFLVARHSRILLCRSCQDPTPWKAAGARLGPTVSVCERCVAGRSSKKDGGRTEEEDEGESGEREMMEEGGDDDDDDQESEEEDEESEEEGEEQVVPWTTEEVAPPPPVVSSSSSEEDSPILKRMRGNVDLPSSSSQDQLPCSSSSRLCRPSDLPNRTALLSPARTSADDEATSDSYRPSKDRKRSNIILSGSHQLAADFMSFGSGRPPI